MKKVLLSDVLNVKDNKEVCHKLMAQYLFQTSYISTDDTERKNLFNHYCWRFVRLFKKKNDSVKITITALDFYKRLKDHFGNMAKDAERRVIAKFLLANYDYPLCF